MLAGYCARVIPDLEEVVGDSSDHRERTQVDRLEEIVVEVAFVDVLDCEGVLEEGHDEVRIDVQLHDGSVGVFTLELLGLLEVLASLSVALAEHDLLSVEDRNDVVRVDLEAGGFLLKLNLGQLLVVRIGLRGVYHACLLERSHLYDYICICTVYLRHLHDLVENHALVGGHREDLPVVGPGERLNLPLGVLNVDLVLFELLLGSQREDLDAVKTADGQLHACLVYGHVLNVGVKDLGRVQGFGLVEVAGHEDLQLPVAEADGDLAVALPELLGDVAELLLELYVAGVAQLVLLEEQEDVALLDQREGAFFLVELLHLEGGPLHVDWILLEVGHGLDGVARCVAEGDGLVLTHREQDAVVVPVPGHDLLGVLVDARDLSLGRLGVEGDHSLLGPYGQSGHCAAPLDEAALVLGVGALDGGLLLHAHVPHGYFVLVLLQHCDGFSVGVPVQVDDLVLAVAGEFGDFGPFFVEDVDDVDCGRNSKGVLNRIPLINDVFCFWV